MTPKKPVITTRHDPAAAQRVLVILHRAAELGRQKREAANTTEPTDTAPEGVQQTGKKPA